MPTQETLTEDRRKQLDSIVSEMEKNKESEENIHFVVNDFKSKYVKKKAILENGTSPLGLGVSERPEEKEQVWISGERPPSTVSPTLAPEEAKYAIDPIPEPTEKEKLAQLFPGYDRQRFMELQTAAEVAGTLATRQGTDFNDEYMNQLDVLKANKTKEEKDLIEYLKQSPPTGELTFMDRVKEIGDNPAQLFPFLSGAVETGEMLKLLEASGRLEQGIETDGDILLLTKYSDKALQDKTFWYGVMDGLAQFPAFAGELLTTAGVYTGVKKVAMKGATHLLKKILTESGQKLLKKKASKIALSAATGVVGATAQVIPARMTAITAGMVQNMLPHIEITKDEQNQIAISITKEGDDILLAAVKSFGTQWTEVLSEKSGGLFRSIGKAGKEVMIRRGILTSFLKKNPKAKVSDFMKIVRKAGYHGVAMEMVEERVGEVTRAALGLGEWELPTPRQLLQEMIVFAIPGSVISGTNLAIEKIQTKKGIKKVEAEIKEAMPFTEAEKAQKEEAPIEEVKEEKPEVIKEEVKEPKVKIAPELRKYTKTTEEKYGYIQEEGKEKRELTKKEFEAEQTKVEEPPVELLEVKEEIEITPEEFERAKETKEFTTEDEKYIITKTEKGLDVFNTTTQKSVRPQAAPHKEAIEEYKESIIPSLKRGKKAELFAGMEPAEVSRKIADESENPQEIAEQYLSLVGETKAERTLEDDIAELLTERRVTRDAFANANDPKNITQAIQLNYFKAPLDEFGRRTDAARAFDTLVERLVEIGEGKYEGRDEQELIESIGEFMTENPNGPKTYLAEQKRRPDVKALENRFFELTKFDITEDFAKKLVEEIPLDIDEINKELLSLTKKEEIPDATLRQFESRTGSEAQELEQRATDIESKAESSDEARLNEAVREADEILKPTTEEREKKADTDIAEGLDELVTSFGGKLSISGEKRPDAVRAIQKIVKGFADKFQLRGEALYQKVRDFIKEKIDPTFLDENRKEIMGEFEKEVETEKKERKFSKRLLETEDISKEIRKGLSEEAKYYIPIKNRITDNEAKAIIEIKGVDAALNDVKNENNELSPATRVTLAENLIYEYNSQAGKVEGKESENLYAKAIEVAEFITQYGTKLGQGIQAFRIWSTLSPEAMVEKYRKDLKKQDIELTKSQEKKIRELTKIAQKAPEGFQKNRAVQDLLKYQMNIEGVDWGNVAMSVWYANILSGYSTQQLNFGANMTQTGGALYTSIIYNPKNAPFLLKGLYDGYGRGILEAWAALKTGYTPINQIKFEIGRPGMPDILESIRFKGGKWNPLNYWKYVRRFMIATDVFSFYGLKEMRSYELAAMMARKEKLDEPSTKIWDRVSDILFKDKIKEAKSQAQSEKLKGLDFKLRVYEILEQSRIQELTEDANNVAAHGTFNYELEGSLGLLTSRVSEAVEAINYKGIKPFKFVVPFTRIVSNVANEYLDWSVWGYVRAARGERGLLAGGSQRFTRELTKEERAKNIIKATTGTIALLIIYTMTDDDDGFFEITANGTGDYKKNYELKQKGWMPYSIRIGKKRFSYINTPLAIPFAFVGNIRDNERYRNNFLSNKDMVTRTAITAYNTMRFVTDMTFLRGFSEFMGSFSEKNPALAANYFERFGKQILKGFIVPNIVTQTSRRMQELNNMPIKQANTLWESIIRDIPIARKGLKDIINALGEPVIPDTDRWVTDVEYDPIWDLIIRNEAWIGRINKGTVIVYDAEKGKMRPVTNDEYYDFSKLRGEIIRKKIEKNLSDLKSMSKSEVKDEIVTYKRDATTKAKKALFAPKPKKKFVY